MQRILIVRLSAIGDIFHTFTVLTDIKQALPNAKISWLVDASLSGVAELCPLIDQVIAIPLRQWKNNKLTYLPNLIKYRQTLINREYDYIIDTQGLIKSAALARFLFKGSLYGLDKSSAREPLASLFYDFTYKVPQNSIAVIRLRNLISKIYQLDIDLANPQLLINMKSATDSIRSPYIFLLYGTSKKSKEWPMAEWIKLARWLLENSEYLLTLTYSNSAEQQFAQEFARQLNQQRVIIINKMAFSDLADHINRARLIIGVDTGFTHLANLLAKPTIALYLDSDPAYVGMLESKIAYNLGGKNKEVSADMVISTIVAKFKN